MPSSVAEAAPAAASEERFQFTGRTGEYFRIWIVNLFLTVITLGIFSAWAKVRKKRYLYGNTWVAKSNFEYHGNPVAILKGRILAFGAFAAYTLATQYSPRLAGFVLVLMMPAVPWLVVRSFAFNAVNSSYRNLRFHFDGTYREALLALAPFIVLPAIGLMLPQFDPKHPPARPGDLWMLYVTPLLFMLVYPYIVAKVRLFQINRARFGRSAFACTATVARFYVIYVITFVLAVVGLFMAGITAVGAALLWPPLVIVVLFVAYVGGGALLVGFTRSWVANLTFNATTLGGTARFASTLKARKLARIYVFNLLGIMLTLGLAVPWAVMRTMRYRAECLAIQVQGDLDSFVGGVTEDVAATGEEVGEMFAIDLSL